MKDTKKYVYYEDFGAKGDGVTDDWKAIHDAHEYANEMGLPVKAKSGATYYIKDPETFARIKTDTDFTGAKFIIDDRGIERGSGKGDKIFYVAPTVEKEYITDRGEIERIFGGFILKRDNFKRVNWQRDYPALLVPIHSGSKKFIRYGSGVANDGYEQQEVISIDKDGMVSEDTPLLFDYDDITSVIVIRTDDKPITVMGGEFTTISNDVPQDSSFYIGRGIMTKRSNTTLCNIKHFVIGEREDYKGCSYGGFFSVEDCQDVLILDCTITARRYQRISGTYEMGAYRANRFTVRNCNQTNFYLPDGHTPGMLGDVYWGAFNSNFSKNLTYDRCEISRFDAHMGVWNAKILNSKVTIVEIVGGGDMLIDNTTFVLNNPTLVWLRGDYGSTWEGNLTLRNCHVIDDYSPLEHVVRASFSNHYFGYTCYHPNIYIENLTVRNKKPELEVFKIYQGRNPGENISLDTFSSGEKNENPTVPPKEIKLTCGEEGVVYTVADNSYFDSTELVGIIRK